MYEVEQEGADLFGAEVLGRGVEVAGEASDAPDVGLNGLRRKLRRAMSSIMRRRKGVVWGTFASERGVVRNNPFTMAHRSPEVAYQHQPDDGNTISPRAAWKYAGGTEAREKY